MKAAQASTLPQLEHKEILKIGGWEQGYIQENSPRQTLSQDYLLALETSLCISLPRSHNKHLTTQFNMPTPKINKKSMKIQNISSYRLPRQKLAKLEDRVRALLSGSACCCSCYVNSSTVNNLTKHNLAFASCAKGSPPPLPPQLFTF